MSDSPEQAEAQKSYTITPEAQAAAAARVQERRDCAEKYAADEVQEKGCNCVDEETCQLCTDAPILEPADELEWLREQYVVLKQNNDSLRQAYSTVGQEASTLRRALVSRQPTLRERAATEACAALAAHNARGLLAVDIAGRAVELADALVAALKGDVTNG